MRKVFLTLAMGAMAMSYSVAQDMEEAADMDADVLTSKKGVPILPQADDYSISLDGTPFLDYFGNMLNLGGNTAPSAAFTSLQGSNQAIIGRKFVDANTAYRGIVRIGFGSETYKNSVAENGATGGETVDDKLTMSSMDIQLGAGLEKRRGRGRLQGYYGAQALIGISSSGAKAEYSNGIDPAENNTYTDWDFVNGGVAGADQNANFAGATRNTQVKNGSSITFGVEGFVGAEFFVAPSVAFGAEFSWGLSLSTAPKGETTSETVNGTVDGTTSTTTASYTGATPSIFSFDTGVSAIRMSVFF